MKLTYIKDQYPTEEICHLMPSLYETDGFAEGVVISNTSEYKSQHSKFYRFTK